LESCKEQIERDESCLQIAFEKFVSLHRNQQILQMAFEKFVSLHCINEHTIAKGHKNN